MDLTIPDDLKEWQDALDALDAAREALAKAKAKGWATQEHLNFFNARYLVEMLRREHGESESAGLEYVAPSSPLIGSLEESESPDLVTGTYGIYSEDEYFDNRERMRNIK